MTAGSPRFPTARSYAGLTLGVVALTLYGSLVPFEYKARSFANAVEGFEWAMKTRPGLESRGDGLANIILGYPLGYCLLAAFRVDRPGRATTAAFGLVLLPACAAFSASVEFLQLWFPKRTCSLSDVLAQTIGAAFGMTTWFAFGPRATEWVRATWSTDRFGGRVGRVLLIYLLVLAAIQVLPFDVTTSPGEVYHRMKDGKGVTWQPFSEWEDTQYSRTKRVEKVVAWFRLAGVFLPAGVLAAGLPGFWRTGAGAPVVFGSAVLLGIGMESAQIPVLSRHASVTDVLIEAGAASLGWAGALAVRGRAIGQIVFATGWAFYLAAAGWYPFDFDADAIDRVRLANLIPFTAIETTQYLLLLNEILEVVVLYGVLGAAVSGWGRVWVGTAIAAALAAVIECGQFGMAFRTPATTDVLLAGVGGGIGAAVWIGLRPALGKGRNT